MKDWPLYVLVVLCIASVYGWCANIYKLITGFETLGEMGGLEVARIVGIFIAPLGSILGFC